MKSKNLHECFKRLGITGSLILTSQFAAGAIIFSANCGSEAIAQITPDRTLPNNSNLKLEGNTRIIEGGTRAGSNLFHSFSEFSVPTNSTALFNNAADIQNIISRVTGNSSSKIDGLIRANGTANLFLINPNGIIFGQNARLDIGGSFFATSANSIKFADGFEFSAKNPQTTPLLTISVPIGLQFGANPGLIQVQGNGQGARDTDSPIIDTLDALRVKPDQTLALVGGDIDLAGATLKTAGGRIELGSVSANGLVSLTPINKGFALGYGGVQSFGNIQLSQQANVDASGEGGGEIQVQGRQVTLTQASQIETSTLGAKQGGDLVVNATESVEVNGRYTYLHAEVYPKATGNAGNLTINTRELLIRGGSDVNDNTSGAGNGGNLAVTADSVQLIGRSSDGRHGSTLAAQSQGIGNAGNLTINTRELLIRDGAGINTNTYGAGKGGDLAVTADSVQVIGSSNGRFSNLGSQSLGIGNAGNLTINTRELLIRDGAFVNTGTFDAGKGGNLAVTADSVQVIGDLSILTSEADQGSTGDAGNLTINTRELLIRDGANVTASTFGAGKGGNLAITADSVQVIGSSSNSISFLSAGADRGSTGDGGDLTINTRELLIRDGAQVSTGTFGAGKGGNLAVTADSVQAIGRSNDSTSGLFAQANSRSTGNGGDLTINTRELLIRDGANVSTGTSGKGKGGNLAVTADNVQVIGSSNDTRYVSFLYAGADRSSTGDAGNLTINTRELLIRDGGQVATGTFGTGKGGNLVVSASSVQVVGNTSDGRTSSGLFASSIDSEKAKAGDITVDANSIVLNNTAKINADTQGGGGNIFVNSPLLLLRRGSSITTNARGNNITGGNITIDAKNGFIVAVPSENSHISANSENYRGGNVTINAAGIFGIQPRKEPSPQSDITATGVTSDLSGTVQINTPDVDPSRGLIPLTVDVVDVARLVDNNICARTANSSFTYTGRGGLPPSPNNKLNSDAVWEDWQLTAVPRGSEGEGKRGRGGENNSSNPIQIVAAQGWIINQNGEVILTAYPPTATPHKVESLLSGCQPPIAK